jgi:hypothetical protein
MSKRAHSQIDSLADDAKRLPLSSQNVLPLTDDKRMAYVSAAGSPAEAESDLKLQRLGDTDWVFRDLAGTAA